jgi:hypothetical protein
VVVVVVAVIASAWVVVEAVFAINWKGKFYKGVS